MLLPSLVGALSTLLIAWALMLTQRWHGRLTLDSHAGIQKLHDEAATRIGGIALASGLAAVWVTSPDGWQHLLHPLLAAGLPALAMGLAEDITKRIGAWPRLGATLGSGLLLAGMSGVSLSHTGVPALDLLLQSTPLLALALTAFAVGGVCNAFNIVDGSHGLASGLALLCIGAIGLMAAQAADFELAGLSLALGAVTLGFLPANFPRGRIFLGDGGAYLLGLWVAWLAILLIERNTAVNPAAVLLACAYPVAEVGLSVLRRVQRSRPAMQPDRLHLHSLLQSRVARKRLAHLPQSLRNASVAPLAWALGAAAALGALATATHPWAAWLGLGAFVAIYWAVYRRLVRFHWG